MKISISETPWLDGPPGCKLAILGKSEGWMHGISAHQLAIWISVCVGGGVAVALSLAVSLSVALRKPEEPDS